MEAELKSRAVLGEPPWLCVLLRTAADTGDVEALADSIGIAEHPASAIQTALDDIGKATTVGAC